MSRRRRKFLEKEGKGVNKGSAWGRKDVDRRGEGEGGGGGFREGKGEKEGWRG